MLVPLSILLGWSYQLILVVKLIVKYHEVKHLDL